MSAPTRETVASSMPQLKEELARLVAIPSISALGYPAETRPALLEAYEEIARLFEGAGVTILDPLELPDTAPVLLGEIPAPDGAPTVLLYSHYDVVPVGEEASGSRRRSRRPSVTVRSTGGARPTRSRTSSCTSARSVRGAGEPPVGIKVVIEGQEEVGGGAFSTFPTIRPELFGADAMVIGDMGSVRPGVPTLTIALRGMMAVTVEARTLAGPKHSGQFGGAAPDALLALIRALATMHDENGDVAVEGLRREPWTGASYTDEEFRDALRGVAGRPVPRNRRARRAHLVGAGAHGHRGRRAPGRARVNAVVPFARAKVSGRVHPQQDPLEAQAALVRHFESLRPYGVSLVVHTAETGSGFAADTAGPRTRPRARRSRAPGAARPSASRRAGRSRS